LSTEVKNVRVVSTSLLDLGKIVLKLVSVDTYFTFRTQLINRKEIHVCCYYIIHHERVVEKPRFG